MDSGKVDYLIPGEQYNPKQSNWEKIKYYVDKSPVLEEGEAHKRDVYTPEPVLLKPPAPRETTSLEDITDFPQQKIIPLMESRSYEEGKYRPPSMPAIAGWFPSHVFLYRGKVYDWCACGHT